MKENLKYIIVLSVFLSFSSVKMIAQEEHPPEPNMIEAQSQTTDCGGGGPGIPPPTGLCMPINDYIIPLLIIGILYGAYKVRKIEKV